MTSPTESYILCEGYYDRAFWSGWLGYLGCADPGLKPGKANRDKVRDPWGERVEGGSFAFMSPAGRFARVVPARGKDRIVELAEHRLRRRPAQALSHLVLNSDSDAAAGAVVEAPAEWAALREMLARVGVASTRINDLSRQIDGETTQVHVVRWSAGDTDCPGVPRQQTLERLVCCSLCAAYPERGPAIQTWLDARPNAPTVGVKEHAWSHMAGWYAERGCDEFYRCLWDDPQVTAELTKRLRDSGAWAVVEAILA